MRRKANLKKFMAFLLSVVMLLSLCTTVFAETPGNSGDGETNPAVCYLTEGCTLENGHEGECTVESDEDETKTKENLQDDETEEESTEETGENETSEIVSETVQNFLSAVDAIVIPEEINDKTGPALNEQIGAASDAYDALSAEDLEREDVQAAVLIMQTAMNALTGGAEPLAVRRRYVTLRPTDALGYTVGAAKVKVGDTVNSYNGYNSYTVRSVSGQEITVWVYLDNNGTFYFPAASSLWENAVSAQYVYWSGNSSGQKTENGSGLTSNGAEDTNCGLATYYINKVSSSGGNGDSATLQVNTVISGDIEKTVNGTPFNVKVGAGYYPTNYASGFDNDTYTYKFTKAERNSGSGFFRLSSSSSGETNTTSSYRYFYPESGTNVVTVYYTATRKTPVTYNYAINYDTQDGTSVAPTTTTSAAATVTLNVTDEKPTKTGYTFLGWAEAAGAAVPDAKDSYTLTSSNPTKTLYAVWSKTPEGYGTLTVQKVFKNITADQIPENFALSYAITPTNGDSGLSGTLKRADAVSGTDTEGNPLLEWKISKIPYYGNGTSISNKCVFTEQNADVTGGYTHKAANLEFTLGDSFSGGTRTITNIYTKDTPPAPVKPDWNKLTIEKTAAPSGTVKPGDTVTYTISVTNGTGRDLKDITVFEKLNENLTFVSAEPAGQYDASTDTWTIASLVNGDKAQLTITAAVKEGVADGTVISNTAAITDAGTDDDENEKLPDGTKPEDKADVTVTNPDKDENNDGIADKFQIKVTFQVENGSWNDGTAEDIVQYLTKFDENGKMSETGTAVVANVPGVGEKPADGCMAGSWNSEPSGAKLTEDAVFVYKYAPKSEEPEIPEKYTVIYEPDGGKAPEGVNYDKEIVSGGTVIVVKPLPEKDGYTAIGWSDGTKIYQPGDSITVTGNITLTVKWKENEKPTKPTEPTDPTQPTEPTEPTDPTKPTEPTQPTDPTKPTDPTRPTDPTKPTEPTKPEEPSKPTNPENPTKQPNKNTSPTTTVQKVVDTPKTGDTMNVNLMVGLAAVSAFAAVFAAYGLSRKNKRGR